MVEAGALARPGGEATVLGSRRRRAARRAGETPASTGFTFPFPLRRTIHQSPGRPCGRRWYIETAATQRGKIDARQAPRARDPDYYRLAARRLCRQRFTAGNADGHAGRLDADGDELARSADGD